MDIIQVNDILSENSTKLYSIEYGGFLSNHMSHGIIALYKLGADKQRIEGFKNWYSNKLEKPANQVDQQILPNRSKNDSYDFDMLLGKRISYYPILAQYQEKLKYQCGNSIDEFILTFFTPISKGILGSALHPLIHMGYGYSIKNPVLVAEGIAYLHHSYLPLNLSKDFTFEFGKGQINILDILDDLRNNVTLRDFMIRESSNPEWMPWDNSYTGSPFLKRAAILITKKADCLALYVGLIKLPQHIGLEFNGMSQVKKLMDWVVDSAIIIYQTSKRTNDFFLLHGVTSAWSLSKILSAYSDNSVHEAIMCVKTYLCVLLAVYMAQDSLVLNRNNLDKITDKSWENIISDVIHTQKDEHLYKLVQICHERASDEENEKNQVLYKNASMTVMTNPFVF